MELWEPPNSSSQAKWWMSAQITSHNSLRCGAKLGFATFHNTPPPTHPIHPHHSSALGRSSELRVMETSPRRLKVPLRTDPKGGAALGALTRKLIWLCQDGHEGLLIMYRWCVRWIGNEVPRKLRPLSNQASGGRIEQAVPTMTPRLLFHYPSYPSTPSLLSPAVFCLGGVRWGAWRVHSCTGMMTLSKWHWLKGERCASWAQV